MMYNDGLITKLKMYACQFKTCLISEANFSFNDNYAVYICCLKWNKAYSYAQLRTGRWEFSDHPSFGQIHSWHITIGS